MKRALLAFCLAIGLAAPLAAPVQAQGLDAQIAVGSSLNHGRAITCSQGQRLLQNRGFRDVRRVDCRGRFYIYHARRGSGRFEVALNSRTGRVVDLRRIRW
ncbi:hypothetical protein [Aminobacter sp. MET-1]|uniref:hypothetical protein n=1 Tax=Aminobacter sp. MET-1 TaxID=2951085 RepID=UPI002269F8A6|nr:hypothetical protein [Aminobacter sp. MET-1]MCX8568427.1 hypothetical protein [Aminobacter sp. MET-1]